MAITFLLPEKAKEKQPLLPPKSRTPHRGNAPPENGFSGPAIFGGCEAQNRAAISSSYTQTIGQSRRSSRGSGPPGPWEQHLLPGPRARRAAQPRSPRCLRVTAPAGAGTSRFPPRMPLARPLKLLFQSAARLFPPRGPRKVVRIRTAQSGLSLTAYGSLPASAAAPQPGAGLIRPRAPPRCPPWAPAFAQPHPPLRGAGPRAWSPAASPRPSSDPRPPSAAPWPPSRGGAGAVPAGPAARHTHRGGRRTALSRRSRCSAALSRHGGPHPR